MSPKLISKILSWIPANPTGLTWRDLASQTHSISSRNFGLSRPLNRNDIFATISYFGDIIKLIISDFGIYFRKIYFSKNVHKLCPDRSFGEISKFLPYSVWRQIIFDIGTYFWKINFWKMVHKLCPARNFGEIFEISAICSPEHRLFQISRYIFEKIIFQ